MKQCCKYDHDHDGNCHIHRPKISHTVKGFIRAMEGDTLIVETMTQELLKVQVRDREKRQELYNTYVTVTIQTTDLKDVVGTTERTQEC